MAKHAGLRLINIYFMSRLGLIQGFVTYQLILTSTETIKVQVTYRKYSSDTF
jgi:hypothetical protein